MTTQAIVECSKQILLPIAEDNEDNLSPIFACSDEMILHILSFLGEKDLASSSLTCHRLHAITNDNILWKNLFLRTFPCRASKVTDERMIEWKPLYQTAYRINSNLINGICQETILPGHNGRITNILYQTPYLFTVHAEGTLRVRSLSIDQTFSDAQIFDGCQDDCIQFHTQTQTIAFPTENGFIKLVRKPSLKEPFDTVQYLPGDGSKIEQLSMENDHLFFVTNNQNFFMWATDPAGSYTHIATISNTLMFARFSNEIAVLRSDNTIAIWKIGDDKSVNYSYSPAETTPTLEIATHLALTGEHLFICNLNGMLKIFAKEPNAWLKEVQNMQLLNQFPDTINSLLAHEDYIITGSLQGKVRIFRKQASKDYAEIPCPTVHTDQINQIVMKEDFLCIASTDTKTSLLRKNPAGGFDLLKQLQNLNQAATTVAIEDDRFISGYVDGHMRIWDFTHTETN